VNHGHIEQGGTVGQGKGHLKLMKLFHSMVLHKGRSRDLGMQQGSARQGCGRLQDGHVCKAQLTFILTELSFPVKQHVDLMSAAPEDTFAS
jgi:hypothetical protein